MKFREYFDIVFLSNNLIFNYFKNKLDFNFLLHI